MLACWDFTVWFFPLPFTNTVEQNMHSSHGHCGLGSFTPLLANPPETLVPDAVTLAHLSRKEHTVGERVSGRTASGFLLKDVRGDRTVLWMVSGSLSNSDLL